MAWVLNVSIGLEVCRLVEGFGMDSMEGPVLNEGVSAYFIDEGSMTFRDGGGGSWESAFMKAKGWSGGTGEDWGWV